MMFVYEPVGRRVVFGSGSRARLGEEFERLGARRALVLSTPGRRGLAEQVTAPLGEWVVGLFDQARMHVPFEIVRDGRDLARRLDVDCLVAVGGGSTVGLAKAIALELDVAIVAVPTTYAGSESTPIWGMTEGGAKQTGRDQRVLPRLVLFDPELTLELPPKVAGPSGLNAMAHCVEALYAPDGNPIVALMAEEGLRALAASLPDVVAAPATLTAREQALYGAWLAGAALGAVSMGLHHKLCHTLGGSFDLPHAETHAVVLPHAAAYNAAAAPEAMARVARALGVNNGPAGLFALLERVGAPRSLAELGLREEDLDKAAELATRNPYANPAPVTLAGVRTVLEGAFLGRLRV